MRITLITGLIASTLALPAVADQNIYELKKQEKAATFVVTKTSSTIELLPTKSYDKYIISVSGDDGFNYQLESYSPTLDINNMKLPYDGTYNYEIKAVQHVAEIKDTMNNGRDQNAVGKISVTDVKSGQFTTQYGSMKVDENIQEPRVNVLARTIKGGIEK